MRKLPIVLFLLSLLLFTNCSTENKPIYTLTTNVNPSEAGSVSPSSGEYDKGTEVELTATPNEGWIFNGWQGDYSGNQNPSTFMIDSDMSVTGQFIKRIHSLLILKGKEVSMKKLFNKKLLIILMVLLLN